MMLADVGDRDSNMRVNFFHVRRARLRILSPALVHLGAQREGGCGRETERGSPTHGASGFLLPTPPPQAGEERDALGALRGPYGISTVSTTCITPFDCSTSAIVTIDIAPLASVTDSRPGPACLTTSSSPSTVLSLAQPPPSLTAFIRLGAV